MAKAHDKVLGQGSCWRDGLVGSLLKGLTFMGQDKDLNTRFRKPDSKMKH